MTPIATRSPNQWLTRTNEGAGPVLQAVVDTSLRNAGYVPEWV
jgi:hypothetical protein